ncbi:hypothetical protein A9Q99_10930 [Gammaproteobacteria bacterium 45_16_T64]|nr:hypothetical protein A9Q99_10930 [Gammaproteobacteria bacterium 45_16_T64]
MKLKTKLLSILIPLILLPTLGIGVIAYEYLQHTALQSARSQIQGLTKQLDLTINNHIDSTNSSLDLLSKNHLVQEYFTTDEDSRYYILQRPLTRFLKEHQSTYPEQYEIRILLPDGYEDIRISNQAYRNNTDNEADSPFFKKLVRTDSNTSHQLYINQDNRSSSLLFSKAIILQDKAADSISKQATFRGFLAVTIGPKFITTLLSSLPAELSADVIVTNANNIVYLSTNSALPTQDIVKNVSRQPMGDDNIVPVSLHGVNYLVGRKNISETIKIFTVVNTASLFDSANRLSRSVIIISAIMIVLSAIILYSVISRMIITPLHALNKAAHAISRGQLDILHPITKRDEIGDLFRSFSTMSRNLKTSTEQIEELAYFDNLTGLPNKVTFFETIGRLIQRSDQNKSKLSVIFFDLDNFKNINDGLGHQMGDLLLMQVGARIKDCLRDTDLISNLNEVSSLEGTHLISRMGGDEFALIISDLTHKDEAGKVAIRILTQLALPFLLDNHEIYIGASIGLAIYPDNGKTPETLLKHADIAMYEAKSKGKNNFQFFEDAMTDILNRRLKLEAAIRNAIEKDEFTLQYQPKVSLSDPTRVEFEALIRWTTPTHGFVSPADFIPIAEESGLIIQIGDWVLNEACRQTKEWVRAGHHNIRVSVNFSPVQINYGNPTSSVKAALEKHKLDPKRLELEITESGLMQNERVAIAYLNSLKELGLSIALDDFGTGYSSLAYLQRFPIDTLKIDRAFIQDMENNEDSQHVLDTIIFLADKLQLETVAEGVETASQLELIQGKGCKIVQGYYFSKPLPASEAIEFFDKRLAMEKDRLSTTSTPLHVIADTKKGS